MRRWPVAVVGSALLLIALLASPADATLMRALSLQELVQEADEILVVRTLEVRATASPARIVSEFDLQVEASAKGKLRSGETVRMRSLGGVVGTRMMRVEGSPMLRAGERALLFARRWPAQRGLLTSVGMSQGLMPVRGQGAGSQVCPGAAGLALVMPLGKGKLATAPAAILDCLPLSRLLDSIRGMVAKQANPSGS